MDHDHDSPDQPDPAPQGASEPEPVAERPGFFATVLWLASKIPLPSLGSERHEFLPAAPPSTRPQTPSTAEASPTPERAPSRFSFLAMKRETRVGMAVLISFVLLVTAMCVQRGWIKTPPAMAMAGPLDKNDNDKDDPKPPKDDKDDPKPPKDDKDDPKPPKDDKDNKKEQPKVTPGDGTEMPDPPKVAPVGLEKKPGTDPGDEPLTLPPTPVEGSSHAPVGETPPMTTPPTLPVPEGSTPRLPDPLPEPMPSSPPDLPGPDVKPAAPPEAPAPAPEAKAKEPEAIPAPTSIPAPVALDNPPPMVPPVEPSQAPVAVTETNPPPIPTPPPSPAPSPVAPIVPVPPEQPPTLEKIPASPSPAPAIESAATRASTVGANWVAIPSGGRRIIGSVPIISTPAEILSDSPRVADGPRVLDDPVAADQVEPVVHVVRAGENFWTISKLYYREGRFYKALHAANRKQVPDIRQLWVGTVLRIPPPEALDRSLIDPPSRFKTDDGPASTVSRTSNARRADTTADEADLALPVRPRLVRPDPEAVEPAAPRRPTYKVKAHETLRSIARDTLNDPKRDREIYNLNRDVLDDINVLPPGTTLTLPEDANLSRRASK
jgi:nucleoid-associated protein YgaU